ncbi:MAG: tRNA lysidine(34) synthetase TilS [Deltaproteobacteria bacterium]|nr:tRNA lysidine(34) synthetase TilS [Deltaproteobacteria bacterium]
MDDVVYGDGMVGNKNGSTVNTLENTLEIVAVSGGPDSIYLAHTLKNSLTPMLIAHYNHRARGKESDEDERFVRAMADRLGVPFEVRRARMRRTVGIRKQKKSDEKSKGFEARAREERYLFLKGLAEKFGTAKIIVAHTADDQVETVLMRILEGAGISGLKGIPERTSDGIERPILDKWREEIRKYLRKRGIPFRVDRSNFDTRFERNWVRHVLIPLLEKRYGKSVKKRIFALGERLREIDGYMDTEARNWIRKNVLGGKAGKAHSENGRFQSSLSKRIVGSGLRFGREGFRKLPSALRKKILQTVCFDRIGISPNERLLESMDRLVLDGGPSARINIGKGAVIRCRYGQALIEAPIECVSKAKLYALKLPGPGKYELNGCMEFLWKERGGITVSGLKRLSEGEQAVAFDADAIEAPLEVRPLRQGDRLIPFGMNEEKKAKEILIDRKVPADERWGRPIVCGADGRILWIPGVVRSAHGPVTVNTRRSAVLRLEFKDITGNNRMMTK